MLLAVAGVLYCRFGIFGESNIRLVKANVFPRTILARRTATGAANQPLPILALVAC